MIQIPLTQNGLAKFLEMNGEELAYRARKPLIDIVENETITAIYLYKQDSYQDSDMWIISTSAVYWADTNPKKTGITLSLEQAAKICRSELSNREILPITTTQLTRVIDKARDALKGDGKIPYHSWKILTSILKWAEGNNARKNLEIFPTKNEFNADEYFIVTSAAVSIVNLTPEFVYLILEATPTTTENRKDDNNTMNINVSTINFECGPITNGAITLSPYGLAIRNADKFYTYNTATKQIVDVTGFTFDMKGMIYKVPAAIKEVRPGDMILHQGKPMYVTDVNTSSVEAIDILNAESKNIVPVTNMFGFNFVTKVVSLVNMPTAVPNADQPFGNLMPMMMMSAVFGGNEDEYGDSNGLFGDIDLGKMFMLSYFTGGDNPFSKMFNFGAPTGTADTEAK